MRCSTSGQDWGCNAPPEFKREFKPEPGKPEFSKSSFQKSTESPFTALL